MDNDKLDGNIPTETIWGAPQTVNVIAPGIVEFTTASHGGIWLSPERNAQVTMELKEKTLNGKQGWYEEDCDASVVREVFKDVFKDRGDDPALFGGSQPAESEKKASKLRQNVLNLKQRSKDNKEHKEIEYPTRGDLPF